VDRVLQTAQKHKDTQATPETARMFAQVNDRRRQAAGELASIADKDTGLYDLGAKDWMDTADGLRRLCSGSNAVDGREYYPDAIKSDCIKLSIQALAAQLVMATNCRPMDPALLTAEDVVIPYKGKFIYLSSLAALQAVTGVGVVGMVMAELWRTGTKVFIISRRCKSHPTVVTGVPVQAEQDAALCTIRMIADIMLKHLELHGTMPYVLASCGDGLIMTPQQIRHNQGNQAKRRKANMDHVFMLDGQAIDPETVVVIQGHGDAMVKAYAARGAVMSDDIQKHILTWVSAPETVWLAGWLLLLCYR
jgi:hypothetical protein